MRRRPPILAILLLFAIPVRAELPPPLIELLETDLSLPRHAEAYYHPLGRHPVTDAVLADPLYLPVYGRRVSEALRAPAARDDLLGLVEAAQRGAALPLADPDYRGWLRAAGLDSVEVPGLDEALDLQDARSIARAWQLFLLARSIADAELAKLDDEERAWIVDNRERLFFDDEGAYAYFTHDTSLALKLFRLAARLDRIELARAQRCLALAGELVAARRESLARVVRPFEHRRGEVRMLIAGRGSDLHLEDADFLVDCGGADIYRNNAGGNGARLPAAFCVDLGGDDIYEGDLAAQGAGLLGLGMLADLGGDDLYLADSFCQGAAFLGGGLLWDLSGNDEYRAAFFAQSAAAHGFSLLWDRTGNDRYTAEGFAQAAATTGGSAFMVESEGDDVLRCGLPAAEFWTRAMGIGQGGAVGLRDYPWKRKPSFYGGLAFLDDAAGDDDLWSVAFCQGGAYCLGTGIMMNGDGDDRYVNRTGGHGAVVHLAAGLMIDEAGNDRYEGAWGSTGVGGDRGVGICIDGSGDDRYRGGSHNLGSARKPLALGLLADLAGNDVYRFEGESCARVQRPRDPGEWPRALFLDLGGRDLYAPAEPDGLARGDSLAWEFEGHGHGLDAESPLSLSAFLEALPARPRVTFAFDPIAGWSGNLHGAPLAADSAALAGRDWPWELSNAGHDERRRLYEEMDLARWTGVKPADGTLSALLARDPGAPADRLAHAAVWAELDSLPAAGPALARALRREDADADAARRLMLRALGKVGGDEADTLLARALRHELDPDCRREAARALGSRGGGDNLAALLDAQEDPSPLVRISLCRGLRDSEEEGALSIVRPLFADSVLQVRRQALLTAVSVGHKPAVGALLESLDVATLDTGENYGQNLFADLAGYLGEEHYERMGTDLAAWRAWWRKAEAATALE